MVPTFKAWRPLDVQVDARQVDQEAVKAKAWTSETSRVV